MKIFKYELKDISAGIHINDLEYLLYTEMVSTFTETILQLKVHTVGDSNVFYFISDMGDQSKMMKVFDDFESDTNIDIFGEYTTSYQDVTDEVLGNIDSYDSITNFNDRNTLLEAYYKIYTPDTILDKILEKGVDSLSKHDKIILDESVKYK